MSGEQSVKIAGVLIKDPQSMIDRDSIVISFVIELDDKKVQFVPCRVLNLETQEQANRLNVGEKIILNGHINPYGEVVIKSIKKQEQIKGHSV